MIYFLTPCSRPENIETISQSLCETMANFDHEWIVIYDGPEFAIPGGSSHRKIQPECHYGKPLLNVALDVVKERGTPGMVGFLDDDTICAANLESAYRYFFAEFFPERKAFTVRQVDKAGKIRIDVRQNPRRIDQGCYFIHTDLIGSHRFFAEEGADAKRFYEADGEFYREIRSKTEDQWIDLPIVGSIYNALR